MIRWLRLLIALSLILPLAHADSLDTVLGIGIGKDIVAPHGAFEKYGTLGVRYGGAVWKTQGNLGYYLAPGEDQKSSFVSSLQGGLEVDGAGGGFATLMFGPAFLARPDSRLSGHFQFHLSGGVGIRAADPNYGIEFAWNHYSNAGIIQPNLGRDLLTVQVFIPLPRSLWASSK